MIALHRAIYDAVVAAIRRPEFDAALPPLSDATWARLLAGSAHMERERLEFLGDALMYATIGTILYNQIPQGSPHLYTNLRGVLHSNAVFSRVAEKLDILAVPDVVLRALSRMDFGEGASASAVKSYTEVKATADLFETVLGAYYKEKGFTALCDWVADLYAPLVTVATKAFYECQKLPNGKRARPYTSSDYSMRGDAGEERKRRRLWKQPVRSSAVPLGSRNNANRADRPSNSMYQYVATTSVKTAGKSRSGAHSVKVKTTISHTPVKSRMSPARVRTPVNVRKTVAQPKPQTVFIDLTLSSDSSDDEAPPPRSRRAPAVDEGGRAASSSSSSSPEVPACPAAAPDGEDDESQEEDMLEHMLMAHVNSDMDLQSEPDSGEMDLDANSDYEESDVSDMDLGSDMSPLKAWR